MDLAPVNSRQNRVGVIPPWLLEKILANLSLTDKCRYRAVCRAFDAEMPFRKINLADIAGRVSSRWDRLRRLDNDDTEPLMRLADNVPRSQCEVLIAPFCSIRECQVNQMLDSYQNLQCLFLPDCSFQVEGINCLPRNVKALEVGIIFGLPDSTGLNGRGREVLANLKCFRVHFLDKEAMDYINAVSIPGFSRLCYMGSCTQTHIRQFQANFANLKCIRLVGTGLVVQIGQFSNFPLRQLSLLGRTANAMRDNCRLAPTLQCLQLLSRHSRIESFSFLRGLVNLRQLDIRAPTFVAKHLALLPESAPLEHLGVAGSGAVGDELLDILMARGYPIKVLKASLITSRDEPPAIGPGFTGIALGNYLESSRWIESLDIGGHRLVDAQAFRAEGAAAYYQTFKKLIASGTDIPSYRSMYTVHLAREDLRKKGLSVPPLFEITVSANSLAEGSDGFEAHRDEMAGGGIKFVAKN